MSGESDSEMSDENNENYIKDDRPLCDYGPACYRKNLQHIKDFRHSGSVIPEHIKSEKEYKAKKAADIQNKLAGALKKKKAIYTDSEDEEDTKQQPQLKKIKEDNTKDKQKEDDTKVPTGPSLIVLHEEAIISIMKRLQAKDLYSLICTSKPVYNQFLKLKEGSKEDIRLKFLNGKQPIPSTLVDVFATDALEWIPDTFVQTYSEFQNNLSTILLGELEDLIIDNADDEDETRELLKKGELVHPFSIAGKVLKTLLGKTAPDGSKFVVAGGSIAMAMKKNLSTFYGSYDIDLFLIGPKESPTEYSCPAADEFFRECIAEVGKELDKMQTANCSQFVLLKNPNTISILPRSEGTEQATVQFVLRKCSSIAELLFFFDLDSARFAFDGTKVWTTEEGQRALKYGVNFVEKWHKNTGVYGTRASKYQGFPTFFFEPHPLAHKIPGYYDKQQKTINKKSLKDDYKIAEEDEMIPASGSEYDMNLKDIETFYEAFALYEQNDTLGRPPRIFLTCEELLQRDCVSELFLARYNEKHLTVTCYICGVFRQLFSQKATKVDRMCYTCKKKNDKKRRQTADLTGQVAIVTGARIKIGFGVTLKLLRANATVIATTRFSADALERYKEKKDYTEWKDNLIIYPLDLKCGADVLKFIDHVKKTYPRIHILVNNAAQTVRRPILYYKTLIEKEKQKLPADLKKLITVPQNEKGSKKGVFDIANDSQVVAKGGKKDVSTSKKYQATEELQVRALEVLSSNLIDEDFEAEYVPLLPDGVDSIDEESLPQSYELFPVGETDEFGEQLDKRKDNSWTIKIDKVHPVEMLEVQAINNIAPSMLISKLMPVMQIPVKYTFPQGDRKASYKQTEPSSEGQFYAPDKTDDHIHNNMSKAALNMLTRSASNYYAKKGIVMNGVDTGWVSSAIPTFIPPPLSVMDGAARVLDPIFSKCKKYGQLFRDFEVAPW